jgi:hypothetical protein
MVDQKYFGTFELIRVDDYIASENGLFHATLRDDGYFCVYEGANPQVRRGLVMQQPPASTPTLWYLGPSEPKSPNDKRFAILNDDGWLHGFCGAIPVDPKAFMTESKGGRRTYATKEGFYGLVGSVADRDKQYHAVVNDDALFCINYGPNPEQDGGTHAHTHTTDPVVDCVDITAIEYHVDKAKVLSNGAAELYRTVVTNNSDQAQSSAMTGSESVSETKGWSDSLGVKVAAKTNFKCGVPLLAEGKVEVSVEVSNTYTWNGSTTTTKTWGFNVPVVVPPRQTIVGLISVKVSTITVPYTMHGTVVLKSGTKLPGQWAGVYTGNNSHDLAVTFVKQDPATNAITNESHSITAS